MRWLPHLCSCVLTSSGLPTIHIVFTAFCCCGAYAAYLPYATFSSSPIPNTIVFTAFCYCCAGCTLAISSQASFSSGSLLDILFPDN